MKLTIKLIKKEDFSFEVTPETTVLIYKLFFITLFFLGIRNQIKNIRRKEILD